MVIDNILPNFLNVEVSTTGLNEREMQRRIGEAEAAGAPIVNYGMAIAQMHGVLHRSLELFPDVLRLMEEERAG